jgi:hypothetical protein
MGQSEPGGNGKGCFSRVHNLVIDAYLPELGVFGLAVYLVLVRHANNRGKSWPSVQRMAGRLKVSTRTVNRAIAGLQTVRLVHVERRALIGGGCRNIYTVLPLSDYESFCKATQVRYQSAPQSLCKATVARQNKTQKKTRPKEQHPEVATAKPSPSRSEPLWTPSAQKKCSDEAPDTTERDGATKMPPRAPDELFDAVAKVTASDRKASGAYIGRVCKALRSADPPYTAAEVLALPGKASELPWFKGGFLTLGFVEKFIGLVRAKEGGNSGGRIPSQLDRISRSGADPSKVQSVIARKTERCGQDKPAT